MVDSRNIIPRNSEGEAFDLYSELLMPSVTEIRGDPVHFDLGGFTHLQRRPDRLEFIRWIRETLRNPEEIRQDMRRDYREIYIATLYEDETDQTGTPFVVVVDRRIQLSFWTAFSPSPNYVTKIRSGRLLWQRQNS